MKKFGKTNTTFELSTLKLGCIAIFMKIWEKIFFWLIGERLLNNRGKNKDEKSLKTYAISELTTLKLGYIPIFLKV